MNYNDRIEQWATENSKKLKILYIIWSIALVLSVVGFGFGFFDNIQFDANKVPVGFMDNGEMLLGEKVCMDVLDEAGEVVGRNCLEP